MAKGDIKIVDCGGRSNSPVLKFRTKGGDTAINAGEPVKIARASTVYVVPLADGDLLTDAPYFVGIAAANATHTTSADGYVDVYLDLPGTVYRAKAKTAANADTQADIDDRMLYRVVIDLTSSKYTVDAAASDLATNGLIIVGGSAATSEIDFIVAGQATWREWANRGDGSY